MGDVLPCRLLLSYRDQKSYTLLIWAMKRRFGQCDQPSIHTRVRGGLQCKLARYQFIRAILPVELHAQVQLLHPDTFYAALEMAEEKETVYGVPWR